MFRKLERVVGTNRLLKNPYLYHGGTETEHGGHGVLRVFSVISKHLTKIFLRDLREQTPCLRGEKRLFDQTANHVMGRCERRF